MEKNFVLGTPVSAVNLPLAVEQIRRWIETGERQLVCVRDAHGVIRAVDDGELRAIHIDAGMVTPDGMPLVWLSRLRGHKQVRRVYGPDLMLETCQGLLALGARHFFYGGRPGVVERLAEKLTERFPGIAICGMHTPSDRPVGAREQDGVLAAINAARPDIVWIGLSTPKQEYWMRNHRPHLDAAVLVGVGAAFDFHAGVVQQAPRILQRNGLEWVYRLCREPQRLGRRYAEVIPRFIWLNLLELAGLRRFDVAPQRPSPPHPIA
jgi:N-acetylglucosaminyldiphosphoundecaprenol N-acetyl-beta-D-mannosaminyltransferase